MPSPAVAQGTTRIPVAESIAASSVSRGRTTAMQSGTPSIRLRAAATPSGVSAVP
jgi:hypothetical protein